jgi:hypothetical protein
MKPHYAIHLSIVLGAVALLPSCFSTSRSVGQTGAIIGSIAAANDHLIDIELGDQRVTGEGEGTVILSLFTMGVTNYATGMALEVSGGSDGSDGIAGMVGNAFGAVGSLLPTAGLAKVKSEALRDACDKAGCDILAYPVYHIEESGFPPIYATYKVEVQGFPGVIKGAKNVPRVVERGVTPFNNARQAQAIPVLIMNDE